MRPPLLLYLTAANALQPPLALITRRRTGRSGARASVRSSTDARRLASVHSSGEKRPNLARTASAAALVAGTTVGGGFLGLPAVVKPAGFVPTVVTLTASWLFLLAEALVVAEAVGRCRGSASLTTVAETAGASKLAVRGLFFALVTATLASQLSKAGTLLPNLSYRAATLAAAVAACLAALGPSTKRAADLNAVLTAVFAASAVGVGVSATTAVKSGALAFDASRLAITNGAAARRSIPTILQLLVFAETVPTVSYLLDGDARQIRQALALGSLAPLVLEGAWACLGIGLITRADPFQHLLSSDPTRLCAILLAASAVATTALGSMLALKSDVAPAASRPRRAALYATLPAVAIAMTSPEVFFKAMDFAGAYPVAILWGVFPPLACLRLRRTTSGARTAGPDAWLVALASVSGLFVASTAARDVRGLFRLLF